MQKIRLRYSHGKLHTKAISAPYAQSYFVACICRLGDMPLTAARQIRLTLTEIAGCGFMVFVYTDMSEFIGKEKHEKF